MSEGFAQVLLTAIDARRPVVFPSELAAEFWRREAVRSGARSAVREDLIISWDRFKESAFDLRADRLPANQTIRALFVARLIAANAQAPFLRAIVPAAYAHDAMRFAPAVARALPALPAARELASELRRTGLSDILHDATEIERRYRDFLEEFGLYEPRWLATSPAYRGGEHLLVMPDLAEDYPQFAHATASLECVNVDATVSVPRLERYADAPAEIAGVLHRIAACLDAGVSADRIVLTVCDLESLRTRLEQHADLLEVPLSFRAGLPLAASAPGRFFNAFGEVVADGFGVESVKRLLLNRAVPWLDYTENTGTVIAGVAAGCIGGDRRPDARWQRVTRHHPRLIKLLLTELPAIVHASTATELRKRLMGFMARAIDRDGWHPDQETILQRSLDELRSLAALESRLGLTVPEPYRLWLQRLNDQSYAPGRPRPGVAVMPYRVGAGVYPAHHFVMNATHSATAVRVSRFPFLSEADRDRLGPAAADRDLTGAFIRAYGCSGSDVSISFSTVGYDAPNLPPGLFVANGTIASAEPAPRSPFRAEEDAAWAPSAILPLQRRGAAEYAATAARGGASLMESPIADGDLTAELVSRVRATGSETTLRLAVADLESFRACPFSYLLSRPLRLRELDFQVAPDNARDIGTYYHALLEGFFKELHAEGERFDPDAVDSYRERLARISRDLTESAWGMVPRFVYAANEPLVRRVAERLLEIDAQVITGHAPEFVEAWESTLDAHSDVLLFGRVDRITRAPDRTLTLVDYKKRSLPTAVSQYGSGSDATGVLDADDQTRSAEEARIGSMQIPFYIRLVEANGERVASAFYYGLEEGVGLPVIDEGEAAPQLKKRVMTRDRMDEVIGLMNEAIETMAARVRAGDYRCGATCDGCQFRAICRTKFVVQ